MCVEPVIDPPSRDTGSSVFSDNRIILQHDAPGRFRQPMTDTIRDSILSPDRNCWAESVVGVLSGAKYDEKKKIMQNNFQQQTGTGKIVRKSKILRDPPMRGDDGWKRVAAYRSDTRCNVSAPIRDAERARVTVTRGPSARCATRHTPRLRARRVPRSARRPPRAEPPRGPTRGRGGSVPPRRG
jgi:hypothetical protein